MLLVGLVELTHIAPRGGSDWRKLNSRSLLASIQVHCRTRSLSALEVCFPKGEIGRIFAFCRIEAWSCVVTADLPIKKNILESFAYICSSCFLFVRSTCYLH